MTRSRVELADLRTMADEIRRRSFGFNRRPGARNNRGRIPEPTGGGGAAPVTPATIFGADLLQWCRADDPNIIIGTGVSAWPDKSGNGWHYTQAVGAAQPAYSAFGGPNGTPCIIGDGIDDVLTSSLALPAPGTTPTFIWIVVKQVTWGGNLIGDGGGANNGRIVQFNATPSLRLFNGAVLGNNNDLPIGTWGRLEAQLSNSASDFLRLMAGAPLVGNSGNNSSTARWLFNTLGGPPGNLAVAEILYARGVATAQRRLDMDSYATSQYGSGLV